LANAVGQGCAWHRPKRFKPTNLRQLAQSKRSGRPKLKPCDAQNLGYNRTHAVGFPIRIRDKGGIAKDDGPFENKIYAMTDEKYKDA
jgi:hypothetical protein